MHKLLKASIAGAAGIALLAGGAGTFAVWNDSAQVSATSIQSGKLSIATAATSAWTVNGTAYSASQIASYLAVPGDVITFAQDVNITATGTNLKAQLTYAQDNATTTIDGTTVALDVTGNNVSRVGTTNVFTVSPNQASTKATAKVTITFDASNKVGQGQSLQLKPVVFTLTQVTS